MARPCEWLCVCVCVCVVYVWHSRISSRSKTQRNKKKKTSEIGMCAAPNPTRAIPFNGTSSDDTPPKVNAPEIISFSCMNKPNEAKGWFSISHELLWWAKWWMEHVTSSTNTSAATHSAPTTFPQSPSVALKEFSVKWRLPFNFPTEL